MAKVVLVVLLEGANNHFEHQKFEAAQRQETNVQTTGNVVDNHFLTQLLQRFCMFDFM